MWAVLQLASLPTSHPPVQFMARFVPDSAAAADQAVPAAGSGAGQRAAVAVAAPAPEPAAAAQQPAQPPPSFDLLSLEDPEPAAAAPAAAVAAAGPASGWDPFGSEAGSAPPPAATIQPGRTDSAEGWAFPGSTSAPAAPAPQPAAAEATFDPFGHLQSAPQLNGAAHSRGSSTGGADLFAGLAPAHSRGSSTGGPPPADFFAPPALHSRSSSGVAQPTDPFAGSLLAPTASAPALLAPAAPPAAQPVVPRPAVPASGGMAAPAPAARGPPMSTDDILGLFNKTDSSSSTFSGLAPPPPMPHRHSASMPAMAPHPPAHVARPAPHQGHLSVQQQYAVGALGAVRSQELFSDFLGANPAAQQLPMAATVGQPAADNWTAQFH